MKMGGGQQLALSRYLLRASSGSIHLETDSWNFSQQPTSLSPSGRSSPARNVLPSRSTGSGSCCSRSISSIAAPNLQQKSPEMRHRLTIRLTVATPPAHLVTAASVTPNTSSNAFDLLYFQKYSRTVQKHLHKWQNSLQSKRIYWCIILKTKGKRW